MTIPPDAADLAETLRSYTDRFFHVVTFERAADALDQSAARIAELERERDEARAEVERLKVVVATYRDDSRQAWEHVGYELACNRQWQDHDKPDLERQLAEAKGLLNGVYDFHLHEDLDISRQINTFLSRTTDPAADVPAEQGGGNG